MKYLNKIIMMLMLAGLLFQISGSFAMEESSIAATKKESKGLIADLKAYKKCWRTKQGCPQELLDRMKQRGKYLAVGAGALAVAAAGLIVGAVAHQWQGPWQEVYPKLQAKFGFDNIATYRYFLEEVFNGEYWQGWNGPNPNLYLMRNIVDSRVIDAAIFIANQRGHKQLADDLMSYKLKTMN